MNNGPEERDGYRYFVERAQDPRATEDENWRLGFEPKHRELEITSLAKNIFDKLNSIAPIGQNDVALDIGAGGGSLARELQELYDQVGAKYIMLDSKEVLNLGFVPLHKPIYGSFPLNIEQVRSRIHEEDSSIKHVIANSILHYVRYDQLLEVFFSSIIEILVEGGSGFIGDVPFRELKIAQASVEGREFKESLNNFTYYELASIANFCANSGATLFALPQPREFPMSPHRLDITILRNERNEVWD
jgi:hypothetical protein